jgi:hypothetical protein
MKQILLFIICISINALAQDIRDKYNLNQTVTYTECINFYKRLEQKYPTSKLVEYGKTDVGIPLHLFMITNDKDFEINSIISKKKTILLINNGIHAGEPCGVDACLGLSEDLLSKNEMNSLLNNVVVCIVPFYNIDGALNRGCCSRANQNGPEEHGFRANAKNLDLNRDFIKCDAQNTKSLIEIIQKVKPHVFVDTHISNGADYAYNMTLITTQHNKLNKHLSRLLNQKILPSLQAEMQLKNNEMCPYVDTYKTTPDSGLVGFLETPRFATGYTALFNIIGFVSEAHMLKPYPLQVKATYDFLLSTITTMNKQSKDIIEAKEAANEDVRSKQLVFPINWKLDTTKYDMIEFKGFEAAYKKSNITGLNRLFYDRNKTYNKKIKFFNEYLSFDTINKPKAYVIPQAWSNVLELLKLNGVQMQQIKNDSVIKVNCSYVNDYKTVSKPYEGHYLHRESFLSHQINDITFYKGDYIIFCNQVANRFIIETLEPKAVDSYFNWNYFDSALQQKEWFSDYVFEETAEKLLKDNPSLKTQLDYYVKINKLEQNHWEQLAWIFKHSPIYEKTAFRYPVFKII